MLKQTYPVIYGDAIFDTIIRVDYALVLIVQCQCLYSVRKYLIASLSDVRLRTFTFGVFCAQTIENKVKMPCKPVIIPLYSTYQGRSLRRIEYLGDGDWKRSVVLTRKGIFKALAFCFQYLTHCSNCLSLFNVIGGRKRPPCHW